VLHTASSTAFSFHIPCYTSILFLTFAPFCTYVYVHLYLFHSRSVSIYTFMYLSTSLYLFPHLRIFLHRYIPLYTTMYLSTPSCTVLDCFIPLSTLHPFMHLCIPIYTFRHLCILLCTYLHLPRGYFAISTIFHPAN
jgi:hypothetical protein